MTDDEFYEATKYTFLGPDPYIPEVPRLSISEQPDSESRPNREQAPVGKRSERTRGWGVCFLLSAILAVELIRLILTCAK